MKKPSRNDVCPCGSGKKYKKCCGLREMQQRIPLKGKNISIQSAHNPMVPLAQRVFSVLTETMPSNSDAASMHEHKISRSLAKPNSKQEASRDVQGEQKSAPGYGSIEDLLEANPS